MYSQYNYYQNNSNSQTQPQQQQMTSTANQVWNGQQWVSTTNNAITNQPVQQSYAQAAAQPQQGVGGAAIGQGVGSGGQGGMIIKHGKTHAELVQHYTSCKLCCVCYLMLDLKVCAYHVFI